jgi:nucleoside-diphosphate-sugar epimerase
MRPTRQSEKHIIGQDDLVLVTGANGFIGYRLVKRLLDRGLRITLPASNFSAAHTEESVFKYSQATCFRLTTVLL